jgi:CxxC-x17-CxxC domain-containing protein
VYQDKTITCIDCGADFVFTSDEQEFYAQHQLTNEPRRCKPCREKRKSMSKGRGGHRRFDGEGGHAGGGGAPRRERRERPRFKIKCHACGREDEVPFEPKEGREVYCRQCFMARRQ